MRTVRDKVSGVFESKSTGFASKKRNYRKSTIGDLHRDFNEFAEQCLSLLRKQGGGGMLGLLGNGLKGAGNLAGGAVKGYLGYLGALARGVGSVVGGGLRGIGAIGKGVLSSGLIGSLARGAGTAIGGIARGAGSLGIWR